MPNTRQVDAGFKIHWQSDVICYLAELESTVTLCAETGWIFIIHHTSYIIVHHTSHTSLARAAFALAFTRVNRSMSEGKPSISVCTIHAAVTGAENNLPLLPLHTHRYRAYKASPTCAATAVHHTTTNGNLLQHADITVPLWVQGENTDVHPKPVKPNHSTKRYDRDMTELTENSTGDVSMEAIACIGKGKTS